MLISDCGMDLLGMDPLPAVVILSGDGDFAHLQKRLVEKGVHVEVSAHPSTTSLDVKRQLEVLDVKEIWNM